MMSVYIRVQCKTSGCTPDVLHCIAEQQERLQQVLGEL